MIHTTLRPALAGLLFTAVALSAACSHNIGYPVGGPETPRSAFTTPYVLALADWKDSREKRDGEERTFPEGVFRFVPDRKLAFLSADVPDALVKHIGASGLFRKVVREAPYERAHLLLAGELVRFRVYARKDALAEALAAEESATAEKPAAVVRVPTRSEITVRIHLWRVDKKAAVWTRTVVHEGARWYIGDLRTLTGLALRDAMSRVVDELAAAMAPYRAGRKR